jgi:WD40 repeat protein
MYSGQCKYTLKGHEAGITSLFCDKASLASSSLDKTVRWWDKHTGECVSELKGHDQFVKNVKFFGYALASAGADSIKLWDMRTSECVRTLENSENVNVIQFAENQIIAGSRDGDLKIFDLKTGEISFTKKFESTISCLEFDDDGKFFIGGDKMTPILFDPLENKILRTFPGHLKSVSCLNFENNILATSSLDKSVKLWNL